MVLALAFQTVHNLTQSVQAPRTKYHSTDNLENRNLVLYNGSKGLKFKVSMSMWMALFLSNRNLTVPLHGEEEAGFRLNF